MEPEIKKSEASNPIFWPVIIAFLTIILVVLAGGIIIILLQGGHDISGKEVVQKASVPLIILIPIWFVLFRGKGGPSLKQRKIITIMLIAALILLLLNILVYWVL